MIYIAIGQHANNLSSFTEVVGGMSGLCRIIEDNVKTFSQPLSMASQTNINVLGKTSYYSLIFQGEDINEAVYLLKQEHSKYNHKRFMQERKEIEQ